MTARLTQRGLSARSLMRYEARMLRCFRLASPAGSSQQWPLAMRPVSVMGCHSRLLGLVSTVARLRDIMLRIQPQPVLQNKST